MDVPGACELCFFLHVLNCFKLKDIILIYQGRANKDLEKGNIKTLESIIVSVPVIAPVPSMGVLKTSLRAQARKYSLSLWGAEQPLLSKHSVCVNNTFDAPAFVLPSSELTQGSQMSWSLFS